MAFYINSFYSKEEVKDEMKRIKEQKKKGRHKMKLTKKNFNDVFDFIDNQINDEVFGLFDEETDLIDAVKQAIEHLNERKNKNEHTARYIRKV